MKFYLDRLYLLEKAKPSWTISVLRRLVPFKTSSPCNKNWIYQHTSNAHVNLAPYSIRCISERQTRPRWSFCRLPRVQVSLTEIPGGSSRRECGDHLLQRGVVHAAENSAQRPGQIASSSTSASHSGGRLLGSWRVSKDYRPYLPPPPLHTPLPHDFTSYHYPSSAIIIVSLYCWVWRSIWTAW